MNLLAIDTAHSFLSAAVSRGEDIFYGENEAGTRGSEFVMELIDAQMKKAHLKPSNLNGVLCMGGPGSFTGLRIAYSFAKGLAASLSIPFAAIPTLDCITCRTPLPSLLLPIMEAQKNAFFYTILRNGQRLFNDANHYAQEIIKNIKKTTGENEKITITGPGALKFYDLLPQEIKNLSIVIPENRGFAKELIIIAKNKKILENDNMPFLYSGPEYIRAAVADE